MVEKLDAKYVKEKISKYLEEKGPSLPVHIAKHISMNTLFTSAFLSEMSSEGSIKISDLKIGGSPLYLPASKINMLENFINHLDSKEREACLLLKEKGMLQDAEQTPVIRVALRSLKDFAIPFKKDNALYWKYFLAQEMPEKNPASAPEIKQELKIESAKPEIKELKTQEEKTSDSIANLERLNKDIEEKKNELESLKKQLITKQVVEKKPKEPKKLAKNQNKKQLKIDETFLNEVKKALEKKSIELLNLEFFDKKQVMARIKLKENEYLLAAFNKKRVEDTDILKAYKKSQELGIPYHIFSKGEASKKTIEAIEAHKKLASISKIESFSDENEQKNSDNKV